MAERREDDAGSRRGQAGCSAGRFSIHSAMASFMWGLPEKLWRAAGQAGQRPELGLSLGVASQDRQVLRAGLASPLLLAASRGTQAVRASTVWAVSAAQRARRRPLPVLGCAP